MKTNTGHATSPWLLLLAMTLAVSVVAPAVGQTMTELKLGDGSDWKCLNGQWTEDDGVIRPPDKPNLHSRALYVGDAYDDVSAWWKTDGFDGPQQALLALLGAAVDPASRQVTAPELIGNLTLSPATETPLSGELGSITVPRPPLMEVEAFLLGGKVVSYQTLGAARSLYELDGKSVVFDQGLGKGALVFAGISPTDLGWDLAGSKIALGLSRYAGEAWGGLPVRGKKHFHMQRGPYHALSVHEKAPALAGWFVNLYDADLPVHQDPSVPKGRVRLFKQVDSLMKGAVPRALHANQELVGLDESAGKTSFMARGVSGTPGRVRLYAAGKTATGASSGAQITPDAVSGTVLVAFDGTPDGKSVEITWK